MASLFSRLKSRPFVVAGIIVLAAVAAYHFFMEWHYNSIDGPKPGEKCWYPEVVTPPVSTETPEDLTETEKKIESVSPRDPKYAAMADAICVELSSEPVRGDRWLDWKMRALFSRRDLPAPPMEIAKTLAELAARKESNGGFPSHERIESWETASKYAKSKSAFDSKSKQLMFETWNLLRAFYREAKTENEALAIFQGKKKPVLVDPKLKLGEEEQKWVTICGGGI